MLGFCGSFLIAGVHSWSKQVSRFTRFELIGLLCPLFLGSGCKPDLSALSVGTGDGVTGGNAGAGGATTSVNPTTSGSGGVAGGVSSVGSDGGQSSSSSNLPAAGAGTSARGGDGGGGAFSTNSSTAGVAGTSAPCVIEPFQSSAQPTLKYDFDTGEGDLAIDASGNALHGSLLGAPTWSGNGRIAGGLIFNNVSQFVELPLDVVRNYEAITVAAWLRASASPSGSTLFDFGSSATNHFYLRVNSGNSSSTGMSYGAQRAGGNAIEVITAYVFPTAVWKHIALTVGDGVATLYVDGQPVSTRSFDFAPNALGATAGNWIARTHSNSSNLWGTVDDFRLYDRVLTRAEVMAIAEPGADYLHWTFDEPCGTKAFDRSSKALVAELPSGASWQKGRFGGAVLLNGTNQYLEFPPGLLRSCDDLTVAMWLQRTTSMAWERLLTVGSGQESVITWTPATPLKFMRFSARLNADAERESSNQQSLTATSATLSPQSGIWGHVAVVLQAGTGRLYFDGQEVATGTISVKPSALGETSINVLGKPLYLGEPFLAAAIDELRISCRAYQPNEIRMLAVVDP
jgi:hypothetical protein